MQSAQSKPHALRKAIFAHQPLIELGPVLDPIREPLVADDDQEVEVGPVALGGVRLVDPGAARIASVEDDLEDASDLLPLVRGEGKGVVKLLENQLHHALKLALPLRGQVIKVGAHLS